MSLAQVKENLTQVKNCLTKIKKIRFTPSNIFKSVEKITKKENRGEVFWPWRVSLSGRKNSPPPQEIAAILGREKTLSRIQQAINKLK
jgi:glutamyl/glutaminyl-tRNA synthetase